MCCRLTVAVRLLRLMGWKEGQGVGPRTKRKLTEQGGITVGCELPTDYQVSSQLLQLLAYHTYMHL